MVCDKILYETYNEAKDAVRGLVNRKQGSFKIYKCVGCGGFHLTTIKKKSLQPIREKFKIDLPNAKKTNPKHKVYVNSGSPKTKSVSIPLSTEKMINPTMARILKGKIEAMNRTNKSNQ